MNEVRHVTFNPLPMGFHSPLGAVCDDYGRDGWRLVQVIQHQQCESVAVFIRELVTCTERCEHGHTRTEGCKPCFWVGGQCRCQRTPTRWKDAPCARCGHQVGWVECPTGGWWAHHEHPEDGHDAVPVVYLLASDPEMVMPDGRT